MRLLEKINYSENRFLMFVIDQLANEMDCDANEKDKVIRLTLGKSELPINKEIIDEMHNALDDYSKYSLVYPAGLPNLKEKLSEYYHHNFDVNISPDNFIISLGTSTIFRNLFSLLLDEDDEVVLPYPYYSLYNFSALLVGAKIKYYYIDTNTNRIDMVSIRNVISDKTRVIVINTPGNPLGNIITEDEIYQIDEINKKRAIIICDEIYSNTYFDHRQTSIVNVPNIKSKFIITNAFSKAYRMYSRRIGYCIVPDEFIEPLTVIQHHTLLTVDPVVQYAAIKALDLQDDITELVDIYNARREYTIQKMGMMEDIRVINPCGGFYISIDCEKYMKKNGYQNSYNLAHDILLSKKVATVPGSDFGLKFMLRLSFSSTRYIEGIDRLFEFFMETA